MWKHNPDELRTHAVFADCLPDCMFFNRQSRIRVQVRVLRAFAEKLQFRHRRFDVTLVDDAEIKKLNAAFRGKRGPTDVLSFPWDGSPQAVSGSALHFGELSGFLGDIVISAETARRNALHEGHSLHVEIQQLMLHGLLHLRGYDHETDHGKMNALELRLRKRLGIEGLKRRPGKRRANRKSSG